MKIKVCSIVGGVDGKENIKVLKEGGNQVIVGTPGRALYMIQKGFLNTQYFKLMILDETDDILNKGFKE